MKNQITNSAAMGVIVDNLLRKPFFMIKKGKFRTAFKKRGNLGVIEWILCKQVLL